MRLNFFLIALGLLTLCQQVHADSDTTVKEPANGYPDFTMGVDVSWTSRIEAEGSVTYYTGTTISDDYVTTVPDMVSDHLMDAVRLRVWVNPSNSVAKSGFSFTADGTSYSNSGTQGYGDKEDMLALAKRFAANGQRLMVAFHLSDTWADPGRQFIPSDWSGCTTASELATKAADHVTEVLTLLKDAGINVAWVQIGNETNTGMLKYELPSSSSTTTSVSAESFGCEISSTNTQGVKNFITVWNAAATAAKSVYPKAKTVLHLAKASKWTSVYWTLNLLNKYGFSSDYCDLIGLSLYPGLEESTDDYTAKWQTSTDNALTTINNIYSYYGFRSILCEIGMNNEWSESTANYSSLAASKQQAAHIAQCNEDVRDFTEYLIKNLRETTSYCDGFFYWEAEEDYLDNYKKGACVSANPGSSWPRTQLTTNDYWAVCKENSTFPDGGLVEVDTDDSDDELSARTLILYSSSWTAPYALSYNSGSTTPSGNGSAMTEVSDGYYKVTTAEGDNRIKFSDNGSNSVTVKVPTGTTFVYNVDNAAWEAEAYQAYDADGAETTDADDEAYGLYYGYNLDYQYGTICGLKNTAANDALELSLPSTIAAGAYTMTGIGPRAFDKNGWRDSNRAFDGNLASVTLPSTIEYIDYEAFVYNQSMTSVTLNEGLKTIGTAAFEGCSALTSITFPSTLTNFYNTSDWVGNFAWCSSLTTVDLSKCSGMTDLCVNTFAECNSLQYVYLPVTLDEIGSAVFTRSYAQTNSPTIELYYRIYPQKELTTFASCLSGYYPDFSSVSGLTAYYAEKMNAAGTAIMMQPVTSTAAQAEGLVLEATAGSTYDIPLTTTEASSITDNLMVGATASKEFSDLTGIYFLSNGEFHPIGSGAAIDKGKAYLDLGSDSSAKSLTLSFADPTGIKSVSQQQNNSVYYNLMGQRITNPQRGMFICNGKKVVIK